MMRIYWAESKAYLSFKWHKKLWLKQLYKNDNNLMSASYAKQNDE